MIARCVETELTMVNDIINESAQAYKGIIPADRWHEPYMSIDEMNAEIASGVCFYGHSSNGSLTGVMGIQNVKDVTLIRHAYVLTKFQGQGIGRRMLEYMRNLTTQPILIGAWRSAAWAVQFYQRNGFHLVDEDEKIRSLKIYWTVPERQIQESIVLTSHPGRPKVISRFHE